MLIGLERLPVEAGGIAGERVDMEAACFKFNMAAVERLGAEHATIILLVTPELVDSTAALGKPILALMEAAVRGDVLVVPIYCRSVSDPDSLPWQALSWMPGKLQPLSAMPNPDEVVRAVCEQIVTELATFSGKV